jgi:hypothetical protein
MAMQYFSRKILKIIDMSYFDNFKNNITKLRLEVLVRA